jgi:hypothetical protein
MTTMWTELEMIWRPKAALMAKAQVGPHHDTYEVVVSFKVEMTA